MSEIERKLATVEIIKDLQPIPDADSIEVATIRGWKVVVRKGEFNVGDFCIYVEIDSVLPAKPEFEFLAKSKYRIKTIRLRGQVSQGICFSPKILEELGRICNVSKKNNRVELIYMHDHNEEYFFEAGDDVTQFLGITKYEPPIPANLSGKVKGNFPSFIIKTDEERIQNCEYLLEKYADTPFYASEKIDGTSFTSYFRNDEFGVCSRNLELKREETVIVDVSLNPIVDGLDVGKRFDTRNTHWKIVDDTQLETKLKLLNKNISLQGEIIGEGIQGNKYKIKGQVVKFFNAFLIDEYKYLDYFDFRHLISRLELDTVPIVSEFIHLPKTMEEMLILADGMSLLNPDVYREGLVFRPLTEIIDPKFGRLSFKVISNKFLLTYKD